MRKIIIALAFAFTITVAKAQQTEQRPVSAYLPTANTKVATANGKAYPYAEWQKLMATGKYKLKPVNADNDSTAFILALKDTVTEADEYSRLLLRSTLFYKRGSHLVLLNMHDVTGKTITAEELKDKIVVINFWQIASPPSRYQINELNRVADAYQNDSNVVFLAITTDEQEYVQQFLNIMPFHFKVIPAGEPYFGYYGITECPVTFVLDKNGNIAFQALGYNNGAVPYWIGQTINKLKTAK